MTSEIRNMLDQEAREAEERADLEEDGALAPLPGQRARRQSSAPSQVYTVRIPVERLAQLREIADQRNEAPSALLRRWALERLDEELGLAKSGSPEGRVASAVVAALLDLAADQDGTLVIGSREPQSKLTGAVEARERRAPRLGTIRRLTTDLTTSTISMEPAVDERIV